MQVVRQQNRVINVSFQDREARDDEMVPETQNHNMSSPGSITVTCMQRCRVKIGYSSTEASTPCHYPTVFANVFPSRLAHCWPTIAAPPPARGHEAAPNSVDRPCARTSDRAAMRSHWGRPLKSRSDLRLHFGHCGTPPRTEGISNPNSTCAPISTSTPGYRHVSAPGAFTASSLYFRDSIASRSNTHLTTKRLPLTLSLNQHDKQEQQQWRFLGPSLPLWVQS